MDKNVIGENIKRVRLARGLTQEQLGKLAGGRSVNQMNGYERGRSRPSEPILAILATALGVPVEELTGRPSQAAKGGVGQLITELKVQLAAEADIPMSAIRVTIEIVN